MAQRTSNIYRLVTFPKFYKGVQWVLGSAQAPRRFVDDIVQPAPGCAILDVGCGPGTLLTYLPQVEYTGMDLNPVSIDHARALHGDRGRFLVGDAGKGLPGIVGKFDVIVVSALLHHLDDGQAQTLFGNLIGLLKPRGRIVTIDNVWLPRQNPIAKLVNALDSGLNVRTVQGYRQLFDGLPLHVEHRLYHDLLRIPYDHMCMILTAY